MTQGNSIKFILFLYCFSQAEFFLASARREHVPKPRDEEALAISPFSLSSSVIYGSDLKSSTSPDPSQQFPIPPFIHFSPEQKPSSSPDRELFSSSTSALIALSDFSQSPSYSPKTSPSDIPLSNPALSQHTILEHQKELARCTRLLVTQYCDRVFLGFSEFKNILNNYKGNDRSNPSPKNSPKNDNPAITVVQDFIKKNLPNHSTEITVLSAADTDNPNIMTAVKKNKILIYPSFFKLTQPQKEAELQCIIANIQADDFYCMNTMHHYYHQISSTLEEEKQAEIENLLEVYQFIRIQAAFIQAMCATENTQTLAILQKKYQEITQNNQELTNRMQNITGDSAVSSHIAAIITETKDYLVERDAQTQELNKKRTLTAETKLRKQSGKKRVRK